MKGLLHHTRKCDCSNDRQDRDHDDKLRECKAACADKADSCLPTTMVMHIWASRHCYHILYCTAIRYIEVYFVLKAAA